MALTGRILVADRPQFTGLKNSKQTVIIVKTSSKPQFTKKWWLSARPTEIKGGDLEKALHRAEQALAAETKHGDPKAIDLCMKAVKGVAVAAVKSIKECDRKKHKDVIATLKKFDPLVKAEIQRLEEAKSKATTKKGSEEEEPQGDGLLDPKYLEKCIRLLRKRRLYFALCMPSNVEAAKFVFARKKSPKFLFTTLNKLSKKLKLGLPKNRMTFGIAGPDKEDKATLVLQLDDEAKQPMGLIKRGKKFLKQNKDQFRPFRNIKLVVNGKVVEDIPDSEEMDLDASSAAAIDNGEAQAGSNPHAENAAAEPTVAPVSDDFLDRQDVATETGSDDAGSNVDLRKEFQESRKYWVKVRNQAIRDLEAVKAGVLKYYLDDPQQFQVARTKLRELDEVMDNLNDDLRDALQDYAATPLKQQAKLQQHGEKAVQLLDTYLSYVERSALLDAIEKKEFADVSVRTPLQTALKKLAQTIRASART